MHTSIVRWACSRVYWRASLMLWSLRWPSSNSTNSDQLRQVVPVVISSSSVPKFVENWRLSAMNCELLDPTLSVPTLNNAGRVCSILRIAYLDWELRSAERPVLNDGSNDLTRGWRDLDLLKAAWEKARVAPQGTVQVDHLVVVVVTNHHVWNGKQFQLNESYSCNIPFCSKCCAQGEYECYISI